MDIDVEWQIGSSVRCNFSHSFRSCMVLYDMGVGFNEYAWGEPLVFDLVGWTPTASYTYLNLMKGCEGLKGIWRYGDLWQ